MQTRPAASNSNLPFSDPKVKKVAHLFAITQNTGYACCLMLQNSSITVVEPAAL